MTAKRFRLLYGKELSNDRKIAWFDTQEEIVTFVKNLGEGISCSIVDFEENTADYFLTPQKYNSSIAEEILDNLKRRKGFHYWWDDIDSDIQEEILEEIVEIVKSKQY